MTPNQIVAAQIAGRRGFVAALDQSGGSTRQALLHYGVPNDVASDPVRMFDAMHEMRVRIVRHASFRGDRVFGAILFERTVNGLVGSVPVPTFLSERGVLPFLKVDQGLEAEANGVRLMAAIDGLEERLERAVALGIVGTKMRSVILSPSNAGIAAIVEQQFTVAANIARHGLLPILEPEVSLSDPARDQCEEILEHELTGHLDRIDYDVALKLTLPVLPDRYRALVRHPRVAKLLALSGGYSRTDACALLARNHGVSASFSRALLEDLRLDMPEDVFATALQQAIDETFVASTTKT